ncbi:hypothetical protein B566_EDAN017807 [Ephemera danica]|nr:hypothetical protein B566_EDAN017807 [Ephemera danica]
MKIVGGQSPKSLKILVFAFFIVYFTGILFALKALYRETTAKLFEETKVILGGNNELSRGNEKKYEVEIWSKAAIGLYLWTHILGGELEEQSALIQTGTKEIKNLSFTFYTGPGLVPKTASRNVTHLILVLNGRTEKKVSEAKIWLDSLPAYERLVRVSVVMLGNEQCDNNWILPYMQSRGGPVSVCFLTYDCPLVDEQEFFQWPLGVAVRFPNVRPEQVDLTSSRPYLCSFMGTIYKNSSREILMRVIQASEKYQEECLVSDLTLSPVGVNTECYRIYEALSMGSVPVIEDKVTVGRCDRTSPLRLLKKYHAPLLYLKDWSQLPWILHQDSLMPYSEKVARRKTIVVWYKKFKISMSTVFTNIPIIFTEKNVKLTC